MIAEQISDAISTKVMTAEKDGNAISTTTTMTDAEDGSVILRDAIMTDGAVSTAISREKGAISKEKAVVSRVGNRLTAATAPPSSCCSS